MTVLPLVPGVYATPTKGPKLFKSRLFTGAPLLPPCRARTVSGAELTSPGRNRLLTGTPALEVGPNRLVRLFCGSSTRPLRASYGPWYSQRTPYWKVGLRLTFHESWK